MAQCFRILHIAAKEKDGYAVFLILVIKVGQQHRVIETKTRIHSCPHE